MSKKSRSEMSKTLQPEINVVSRIYPVPFVNSKGFRIGDYKIIVNGEKLPFNSIDQANYMLHGLFDYASYKGMPKTIDKEERDINSFFPYKKVELEAFTPIRYPDLEQQKILEIEQNLLLEENKRLRQNLRTLQNKLAEITGNVGDPDLRKKLKELLKEQIDEEIKDVEPKDKQKVIQKVLSESLNAVGELEDNEESFRPRFPKAKGGRRSVKRTSVNPSKIPSDFILIYKVSKNKKEKSMKNKTLKKI